MVFIAGHIGGIAIEGIPGDEALSKIGLQGQVGREREKEGTNKNPNPMGFNFEEF